MPTANQKLGEKGEKLVIKNCICFKCKRKRTLRRLPPNFKCADIICDFCGYLAQVKTVTSRNVDAAPKTIRGAAWNVIHERMQAGIYFPLFIVQINGRQKSIFYLPTDLHVDSSCKCNRFLFEEYLIRRLEAQPFTWAIV
jgi:type II restriction enzyme